MRNNPGEAAEDLGRTGQGTGTGRTEDECRSAEAMTPQGLRWGLAVAMAQYLGKPEAHQWDPESWTGMD